MLHQKIPIPVAARYTLAEGRAALSKFFPNLILGISGLVTLSIELWYKRLLCVSLSTEPRADDILFRWKPFLADGFHLSEKAGDILDSMLCPDNVLLAPSAHGLAKPPSHIICRLSVVRWLLPEQRGNYRTHGQSN